jgi:hypothetical protein
VALLPPALAGPGLPRGRGEPGPGHQGLRGREAAHVQADLADQRGGGFLPRPGISSSRSVAGSAAASAARPACGPVTPSESTPQDAGSQPGARCCGARLTGDEGSDPRDGEAPSRRDPYRGVRRCLAPEGRASRAARAAPLSSPRRIVPPTPSGRPHRCDAWMRKGCVSLDTAPRWRLTGPPSSQATCADTQEGGSAMS